MNIKTNITAWCIDHANMLIHLIQSASKPILFILSFLIVVAWLVGEKISGFAKPENPKSSRALREAGSLLKVVGSSAVILSLVYLIIIFSLVLFGFSLADQFKGYGFTQMLGLAMSRIWLVTNSPLLCIISGAVIGLILSSYLTYYLIPEWERGEGLDDVGRTVKLFKKFDIFNATKYFDNIKGCFVGNSVKGVAIYIPWAKLRETHVQVLGTTGSGKGIVTTVIASQCIMNGEGIVWFDPKFDKYSPKIMAQAAAVAKKKFHLINLNPHQPAQFNLMAGCTANEVEEMLVAGFDLQGNGTDADFYRGKDEDAAILMANSALKENISSIPQLLQVCSKISEITEQENFWRKFRKLASLSAINTAGGLNLQSAILSGDVIYVVGSCDNERVKMLQKMLLVRVMQIIKKRDRTNPTNPVCVVLDEFKYLLSSTALSALGVVRDFDAHFILAHQSLGDLAECPGISPESAYGAVVDNTSIKILYRLNDPIHAEKMAKLSGNKRVFVESTSKNSKDTNSHSSGWKEATKYFISPDLITHLPIPSDRQGQASVGILFGLGNAKVLHVGRIEAKWKMPKPLPAITSDEVIGAAKSAEDLI